MDRDNPIAPKGRYKNGVVVALDICDTKRAEDSGLAPPPPNSSSDDSKREALLRTAAIVAAGAAKLNANDLTALEAVCASHVLALDVIFNEFARDAARVDDYLSRPSMSTALRAQSQCRMMLKTLVSLDAQRKTKNSYDRNIESANPPT
jgi:hypothetical protein